MDWQLASEISRVVAASHVVLITALFFYRLPFWDRIIVFFLGIGVAVFLVFPMVLKIDGRGPLKALLLLFQSGFTFWFWLLAISQKRDSFKPDWRHWLLLTLKSIITILWIYPGRANILPVNPAEEFVWRAFVPASISIAFTVAAVVVSVQQMNADLVEERRRLRSLFIFWGAGGIIVAISVVLILRGPVLDIIANWLTTGMAFGACISLHFWWEHRQASGKADTETTVNASPELRELAARITAAFENEDFYQTEGLTVNGLAKHLGVQEYKVRRAINGVMGYRNFMPLSTSTV